jgi:hypothetical protein
MYVESKPLPTDVSACSVSQDLQNPRHFDAAILVSQSSDRWIIFSFYASRTTSQDTQLWYLKSTVSELKRNLSVAVAHGRGGHFLRTLLVSLEEKLVGDAHGPLLGYRKWFQYCARTAHLLVSAQPISYVPHLFFYEYVSYVPYFFLCICIFFLCICIYA